LLKYWGHSGEKKTPLHAFFGAYSLVGEKNNKYKQEIK
jgi:hypothetical protein